MATRTDLQPRLVAVTPAAALQADTRNGTAKLNAAARYENAALPHHTSRWFTAFSTSPTTSEVRRVRVGRHSRTRVVAPVSGVGMAAAELLTSRLGAVLGPTLFLPEDGLDASETRLALDVFLSATT